VGDYIEEQIENPDFGRIAAQAAKQVIVQRVREAERAAGRGCVEGPRGRTRHRHRQARRARQHLVDLGGNAEAFIPKDKGIPRDVLRAGDRVRGYLATTSAPNRVARSCSSAAPRRNS
jgi:N utilization substance protein A